MSEQSGIHRVVEEYGGSPSALANAIGGKVVRQHVEYWLKAGKVPAEHVAAVHKAGRGVVALADLNPDIDWDYLREPAPTTRPATDFHDRAA